MSRATRRRQTNPALDSLSVELARLFAGVEVYGGLTSEDLREMSKLGEQPNALGLAAHRIERPVGDLAIGEMSGGLDSLPPALLARLRRAVRREPTLLIQGLAAGGCGDPIAVTALIAQSAAHLARGYQYALWPSGGESKRSDLCILHVPDFDEAIALGMPNASLALILGTDDLRPGLMIAIEMANRRWSAQEDQRRLLAGGSFAVEVASDGEAAPALFFSGESLPSSWERMVARVLGSTGEGEEPGVALAGAEPWVAESGGWLSPFFFNPVLPLGALASSGRWLRAALDPDALSFGLHVTAEGAVRPAASDEDAFAVIPRRAIPPPFMRSAAPLKPARLFTHGHSKPEAMEIWAMGFPHPELM